MTPADRATLRPRDYAILVAYCAVLFCFPLLYNRTLTTHETVHCLNVREMRADGDWVIPHYGGRPWLERPPLPFWLTIPVIELAGDHPAAYRFASVLVGTPCVLLVAWVASVWYGRGTGLLSGLILASMRQFNHYSAGPEADIFLCLVVTAALALFVRLEWRCPIPEGERWLVGRRPWALLAFFVVLGMANLVKGLFFGDVFILLPVAAYLLLGPDRLAQVRRYAWLPGLLAFAAVGSSWALAAYWRYPDVVEFWKHDYGGRVNQGYMREPVWYYFAHLPLILFPWTAPALAGLWLTRGRAFGQGRTPERFLWCWALVPLFFFSIPQGKHCHYLLHAMAPWAILGAVGAVRLWEYLRDLHWLATPWPALIAFGLPVEAALIWVAGRYQVPGWLLSAALACWPLFVLAGWFSLTRRSARQAAAGACALAALVCWLMHAQPRLVFDRYASDLAFVSQVRHCVPDGDALLVLDDWGPLDASWLLFHLKRPVRQLHNATFLREEDLEVPEVYVVARRLNAPAMSEFGECRLLFESAHSRGEPSPDYRLGLYKLRFDEGLPRHRGKVYISPCQAAGRTPGPRVPAPGAKARGAQSSSPDPLAVSGR